MAFPLQTKAKPVVSHLVVVDTNGKSTEMAQINGEINHTYIRPQFQDQILYMVVDNGMWLINMDGSHNRRVRPDTAVENVSHPFWGVNGKIAYYTIKTKKSDFLGQVNPETDTLTPLLLTAPSSTHMNINPSETMLVGDGKVGAGKAMLLLYKVSGSTIAPGQPVFAHNSSFATETVHPHPTFINETDVVFNSDRDGNGNIYLLRKIH